VPDGNKTKTLEKHGLQKKRCAMLSHEDFFHASPASSHSL
jgi:hypothetical protein